MEYQEQWVKTIVQHTPFEAEGYQLETQIEGNRMAIWPPDGTHYRLDPFDFPNCPAGMYRVYYCAATGARLPPREARIVRVEIDLGLGLKSAHGSETAASPSPETERASLQSAEEDCVEPSDDRVEQTKLDRIDRELRQAILTQEIDDTAQDLLHKSLHVRDLSEHYAMHRVMRRDFQLLYDQAIDNAKRLGDVIQHFSDLHSQGMARLKEQIDLYTRPLPPPPPPDYSGVAQAGFTFLRDVAVALIQKNSLEPGKGLKPADPRRQLPSSSAETVQRSGVTTPAEPTPDPASSATAPKDNSAGPPAPATAAPAEISVPPVSPPAPPELDPRRAEEILSRLRGLDEVQVATMLSSPELMRKFFELVSAADGISGNSSKSGAAP